MKIEDWFNYVMLKKNKRAIPIITFPATTKMNISVKELINNTDHQVEALKIIKEECNPLAVMGFMDLSVEAECFGAQIKVSDNEVPTVIGQLIEDQEDALALKVPKIGSGRTQLYIDAIKKTKAEIKDVPVLAGCIGPFSLAGRLMDVSEAMINCYEEPEMVHIVLEKVTDFIINYILAYKKVGADGILIAEPLAGVLSPALATEFSSTYVKQIVDATQDEQFIVIYHNCGNNTLKMVEDFKMIGAKAYHFGNAINILKMLEAMPVDCLIMGNIDPVEIICNSEPAVIKEVTVKLLEECAKYNNFIISSGCDIPPLAPWSNIKAFMEASENYYENNS